MNEPDKDAFDSDALALRDLLIQKANELREHCDSVVILCTLSEGADSQMVYDYKGNIYAVDGSVQRFIEMRSMAKKKLDEESE